MARLLTANVALANPETGLVEVLQAGTSVPAWADELITNPKATADAAGDGSGPPPRAGRGSSAEAWAAYADSIGIEVLEGATRDDIIAAVDAAA